jgi:hypothetical protein
MALRASPNRSHSAVEDPNLSAVALGGDGSLSVVVGQIVNGQNANDDARLQLSTCWTQQEINDMIDRRVELLSQHHGTTYSRDVLGEACKQHGPNCSDILCQLCSATTLIASHLLENAGTEG